VPSVLIVYATTEGHTARVAERMAERLRAKALSVALHRAARGVALPDLARHDGVIVGASVHYGRHPAYLRAQLRERRSVLAAIHAAFFSVSLSAGGPGAKPEAAQRYVAAFLRGVSWRPAQVTAFGGAAQYSKYGWFKRLLMIAFIGLAGGDTDTSRDYEYTDWEAVDRFADEFARPIGRP
jgi:menaquinone-dependent protoporphyrinogen oxidase